MRLNFRFSRKKFVSQKDFGPIDTTVTTVYRPTILIGTIDTTVGPVYCTKQIPKIINIIIIFSNYDTRYANIPNAEKFDVFKEFTSSERML